MKTDAPFFFWIFAGALLAGSAAFIGLAMWRTAPSSLLMFPDDDSADVKGLITTTFARPSTPRPMLTFTREHPRSEGRADQQELTLRATKMDRSSRHLDVEF